MTRVVKRNITLPFTLEEWLLLDRGAKRRNCSKVKLIRTQVAPMLKKLRSEQAKAPQ